MAALFGVGCSSRAERTKAPLFESLPGDEDAWPLIPGTAYAHLT